MSHGIVEKQMAGRYAIADRFDGRPQLDHAVWTPTLRPCFSLVAPSTTHFTDRQTYRDSTTTEQRTLQNRSYL